MAGRARTTLFGSLIAAENAHRAEMSVMTPRPTGQNARFSAGGSTAGEAGSHNARIAAPAQPTASRAATNAATQVRTSSALCAADNCTLIRALPRGTTGKLNAIT